MGLGEKIKKKKTSGKKLYVNFGEIIAKRGCYRRTRRSKKPIRALEN